MQYIDMMFNESILWKIDGFAYTSSQVKIGEINDDGWVAYESSHFGTFSGKLFVAPNTIDFANVFGR